MCDAQDDAENAKHHVNIPVAMHGAFKFNFSCTSLWAYVLDYETSFSFIYLLLYIFYSCLSCTLFFLFMNMPIKCLRK